MEKLNWCRMLLLRPTSAIVVACAALTLAACSGAPARSDRDSVAPAASSAPAPDAVVTGSGTASSANSGAPVGASGTANPGPTTPVPARALSDFNRAVGLMKAGNSGEAELEFKTLAAGYPQLAGAQINLALLQRKANRLDEAEATLK